MLAIFVDHHEESDATEDLKSDLKWVNQHNSEDETQNVEASNDICTRLD